MGIDFNAVCDTCEVFAKCGDGSHSSWLVYWRWDGKEVSVENYDAAAALPENAHYATYGKNKNIRHFLVEHQGHKLQLISGDSESWNDFGGDDYVFGLKVGERPASPQYRYTEVPHPYQFGCGGCVEGSHFLKNKEE
jgi:hypothetical protein